MCPAYIQVCCGCAPIKALLACMPSSTFVFALKPVVPCLHQSLLCFAAPDADTPFLLSACDVQPSTHTSSKMHAPKTLRRIQAPQASCWRSHGHLEAPKPALSHG